MCHMVRVNDRPATYTLNVTQSIGPGVARVYGVEKPYAADVDHIRNYREKKKTYYEF